MQTVLQKKMKASYIEQVRSRNVVEEYRPISPLQLLQKAVSLVILIMAVLARTSPTPESMISGEGLTIANCSLRITTCH